MVSLIDISKSPVCDTLSLKNRIGLIIKHTWTVHICSSKSGVFSPKTKKKVQIFAPKLGPPIFNFDY